MPTYFGTQEYYDIRLGTEKIVNIIQPPAYVVSGSTLLLDGAYYPGSGTRWQDISGYGNNATLTNPGPTYSSLNGGYFDFPNDQSKYMTVAQATALNNTFAADFTIDIWFTIDAFATGLNDFCTLFAKVAIAINPGCTLIINRDTNAANRGDVRFYPNGADIGGFATKITLVTGQWVNLQIVRSGSTITAYNNTTSIGTKTSSANMTSTNTLFIGVIPSGTNYQLDGKIGWFTFYNRALSTAELTQNFNANRRWYNV